MIKIINEVFMKREKYKRCNEALKQINFIF